MLENYLLYPYGLYALLALVPLILIYIIRPRPKNQTIPALMFMMKEMTKRDKSSFLRRFIRDLLFVFQVLLLIVFAVSIAKPFIVVSAEIFVEKTAIVIDISGSSNVVVESIGFEKKSRFERSVDIAKQELGDKNTLIAVTTIPELIGDGLSKSDAGKEIDRLVSKHTETNLFDALIFAGNYIKAKDRVVVISDFLETGSQKDIKTAKSILESKGIRVDFINVLEQEKKAGKKANNIGIIDVDVKEDNVFAQIKNYNSQSEKIGLKLKGANLTNNTLTINAGSVEVINFDTPSGISQLELIVADNQDDFALDNLVYISAPVRQTIPVLVVSNNQNKYFKTALEVMEDLSIEYAAPPKVPTVAHQIIVFDNVNTKLLLPGVVKETKKAVESGASLVIMAQDSLLQIDFEDMLPVKTGVKGDKVLVKNTSVVVVEQQSSLTNDMNFGKVNKFFDVEAVDGATVLAKTSSGTPLVVVKNIGKGTVVYYGLFDEDSDFKLDIYYPIFWKRLFDLMLKKQDINKLNYETGKIVPLLSAQKVKTPAGTVTKNTLFLEYVGEYETAEKTLVANLISDEESNINGEGLSQKKGVIDDVSKKTEDVNFDLSKYFIMALLCLVFIELLWIKFRGDL